MTQMKKWGLANVHEEKWDTPAGLGWENERFSLIYFDAFSPEALAQALEEIWSLDDAEMERRRDVADRACRSRFGIETVGPQLRALLSGS